MLDEAKVKEYMLQTNQKAALLRHEGRFYYVKVDTELTAWENYPVDSVRIIPLPPPVELV